MYYNLRRFIPHFLKRVIYKVIIRKSSSNIEFGRRAYADLSTRFGGNNSINDYSSLTRSEIGFGSYIAGHTGLSQVKIGRYCSIGQNVKNCFGIHPTDHVSTHPSFYSTKKQAGFTYSKENKILEHKYADKEGKFINIIGNDVWIGNNVSLMDGITIGDGAIIGTGAVVTKDVAPYEIVGGIPAKRIKHRFSDDIVLKLLEFKWWEQDEEWLRTHSELFENPTYFIKYISSNEAQN